MRFSSCLSGAAYAALLGLLLPSIAEARSSIDPGQVEVKVASFLEQGHYTRHKLDEEMSRKILETYLTALDYNKLYFTQQDVDEFVGKYGGTLNQVIVTGDLGPAREIFARFKQRVENRVAKNKKLADKHYAFDSKRTVEINRQEAPWAQDEADADQIWQNRIEAELLKENLADHQIKPPKEVVAHRYDQALKNVHEMDDEDVVKSFLTSVAQAYDPHSEYLSPSDLENFQISMKLSLVGVGAVLSSEEGYAKVKEIVPGGPADKDGRLKVNDRIAAVAQGSDEFEDVVDMKLDKVVEKIRGKKGSTVRLMVIPGESADPSKREIVEIHRDEVKLKDSAAKADVLEMKDEAGHTTRIGWITLPSFYANMTDRGEPKSTTDDVNALLTRLKKEGIQGLVMDLRQNGGGSLEEAINLTGLFIPRGPVVQSKDSTGKITVSQDSNPGIAFGGPMIVLTNRLSASASEIFAAALQDYGRAVIVGDERSFGKGTVQTVLDLGRVMPLFSLGSADAGALKLTIQKFYRVKGGSTQLKGVESDIILPSRTDNAEIGEGSLKNRLPYDEVAPAKIDTSSSIPLFIDQLKELSAARIPQDPEFQYVLEDTKKLRQKITDNTLSLNAQDRRKEMADDKLTDKKRDADRLARGPALNVQDYELTLDEIDAPKLRTVAYDRKRDKSFFTDDVEEGNAEPKLRYPILANDDTLQLIVDGSSPALAKTGAYVKGMDTVQDAFNLLAADKHPELAITLEKESDKGVFGAKSETVVLAFQKSAKLEETGKVDEKTLAALDEALVEMLKRNSKGDEWKKMLGPTAKPDPIRNETLRIMQDYVRISLQNKTASIQQPTPVAAGN